VHPAEQPKLTFRTEALEPDAHFGVPHLVDLLPAQDPVAWIRRGEGMVGWGVAARLQVRGDETFSRAQRWWNRLLADSRIADSVDMPGTGAVAFASFAFDLNELSEIVIPKFVVGTKGGQSWITTVSTDSDVSNIKTVNTVNSDSANEATHNVIRQPAPVGPTEVTWSNGSLSPHDWEKAVATAVERIQAGELDKVVLARDLIAQIDGELDIRYMINRLAAAYPTCWTFVVRNLVGATPELLVRRTGNVVMSRVLAGTVRRQGNASTDSELANALLNSDKDLAEHAYAVHSVARALAAHCTDLEVPETPQVLELSNVQHLATDVTGQLAIEAPILALVASLHPTAAVCGTPTERAKIMISDLEGMNRKRYAGPVGWFDHHGDGEFGIALRCAEVDPQEKTVRSFAGCGIVAGSDPEMELAESIAKLAPIRDSLAGD